MKGQAIQARVGSPLVLDGDYDRVGLVLGVQHADVSPPYLARWLSGWHVALMFPRPYASILPDVPVNGAPAGGLA
jgi:hypothetical protein